MTQLPKTPTGIPGFDEITGGGLPAGRPSLVCGGPGCGKTLFAISFLAHGAVQFGEPGVLMSFEENAEELAANVASLGFDLPQLVEEKKLAIDHVRVERSEIEETGEYDLEALFVRLGYAIDTVGARRVVLDTIESLFAGLSDSTLLRAELRRLFRWLKDRGVTAVITGERGDAGLTRQGLEEYVSDAVVLLDHRIENQISTRRLRIVKYRGSAHGTNEYPFLVDADGMSVLPLSSVGLGYGASTERVSSGIARLDTMLGGHGFYRGTTVLVSGTAGVGKSTIAAHFVDAACRRGERCLVFLSEESPAQVARNMRSVGIDLEAWVAAGLLRFEAARPTSLGLETHLSAMYRAIRRFRPTIVVLDPITSLMTIGTSTDVRAMLTRLIDFLRTEGTTALLTSLTHGKTELESTDAAISSLVDSWLLLLNLESGSERNRALYVLKSRGMAHSNQIREFLITSQGVQILDVYAGAGGALMGSARLTREAEDRAAATGLRAELDQKERELARRRAAVAAEMAALQARLEADEAEMGAAAAETRSRLATLEEDRGQMERRKADPPDPGAGAAPREGSR